MYQNRERERAGDGSEVRASDEQHTRSLTLAVPTGPYFFENSIHLCRVT
jgi:hypothetical protein